MANPNNTETFRRRGGPERQLDDDGVNNREADKDRLGNLTKFSEHKNDPAAYPNRDRAGEPSRKP